MHKACKIGKGTMDGLCTDQIRFGYVWLEDNFNQMICILRKNTWPKTKQRTTKPKKIIAYPALDLTWLCFYQTRSAWSRDQESNKNHTPAYNFAPTVTKFCVMWEGLSLPHDTKFSNCRCQIVDSRVFPIWSLIHGSSWSGLIKAEPGDNHQGPLLLPWINFNRNMDK